MFVSQGMSVFWFIIIDREMTVQIKHVYEISVKQKNRYSDNLAWKNSSEMFMQFSYYLLLAALIK